MQMPSFDGSQRVRPQETRTTKKSRFARWRPCDAGALVGFATPSSGWLATSLGASRAYPLERLACHTRCPRVARDARTAQSGKHAAPREARVPRSSLRAQKLWGDIRGAQSSSSKCGVRAKFWASRYSAARLDRLASRRRGRRSAPRLRGLRSPLPRVRGVPRPPRRRSARAPRPAAGPGQRCSGCASGARHPLARHSRRLSASRTRARRAVAASARPAGPRRRPARSLGGGAARRRGSPGA